MSLFADLPFAVAAAILAVIGAMLGAAINLGIYQLCYNRRLISPWSPVPQGVEKRSWLDRIPVIGWFRLKRESKEFGKHHWVRPMLIEFFSAVGLVALFWWYSQGGLGTSAEQVTIPSAEVLESWNSLWFLFHATLFALLAMATFIDFDERTIPDWITIPGTLFALIVSVVAPQIRLPVLTTNFTATSVEHLHFGSPGELPQWFTTEQGLLAGIAVIVVWCFGLLPKFVTLRYGVFKAFKFLAATIWPRPRKTKSKLRVYDRGLYSFHYTIFTVLILTCLGIWFIWQRGGQSWESLCGSLLGMAVGGGITWAVRIVASFAAGEEAMGFGDVTLMAMVGAFLGWQPSLLIFFFAPFTSIAVVIVQFLTSGDSKIAFGPYLCIACAIVLVAWNFAWNDWAGERIFSLGSYLIWLVGGFLIATGIVLFLWVGLRNRMQPEDG